MYCLASAVNFMTSSSAKKAAVSRSYVAERLRPDRCLLPAALLCDFVDTLDILQSTIPSVSRQLGNTAHAIHDRLLLIDWGTGGF